MTEREFMCVACLKPVRATTMTTSRVCVECQFWHDRIPFYLAGVEIRPVNPNRSHNYRRPAGATPAPCSTVRSECPGPFTFAAIQNTRHSASRRGGLRCAR